MVQTNTIVITPEWLSLISEIDEFKGAWRALGTLAALAFKALAARCNHRKYRLINTDRGKPLRFSKSRQSQIEEFYSTHYLLPKRSSEQPSSSLE